MRLVVDHSIHAALVGERKRLEQSYEKLRPVYETALRNMYEHVRTLITTHGINAAFKFRVKTFDSYFIKLARAWPEQGAGVIMNDMIGMRIVCPFLDDVTRVEQMLNDHFEVLEVERKGRRQNIREFGYDSIHILVGLRDGTLPEMIPHTRPVCEVQLRTILQDAWAEVEHELVYKADDSPFNETIKRKLAALNATLALSDIIFQEIREYQKTIQHRDAERRRSMHEQALPAEPISLLESVDGLSWEDSEAMEQLTLTWGASGRPGDGEAPDELEPAQAMQPQSEFERLLFAALEAHGAQDFSRAIEIYTRILEMALPGPVRAVVFNHRGMARFGIGEYEGAVEDFSSALVCDPRKAQALNNRALAWRMQHAHARALEDVERSLQLNPLLMEGYYIRSLVEFDLGDYTRALGDCDRALNLKPAFAPAERLRRVLAAHLMK